MTGPNTTITKTSKDRPRIVEEEEIAIQKCHPVKQVNRRREEIAICVCNHASETKTTIFSAFQCRNNIGCDMNFDTDSLILPLYVHLKIKFELDTSVKKRLFKENERKKEAPSNQKGGEK